MMRAKRCMGVRIMAERRAIPILPSLLVAAAVATMVALGIWQIERLHWKEGMLARFHAAQQVTAPLNDPGHSLRQVPLYRHASIDCRDPRDWQAIAGRNAMDDAGFAHVARCTLADGTHVRAVVGWSTDPATPAWAGGRISGVVAPAGVEGPWIVSAEPMAGLVANAMPDPKDTPNNHLFYAIQWFIFAGAAAIIYALALRRRWREDGDVALDASPPQG